MRKDSILYAVKESEQILFKTKEAEYYLSRTSLDTVNKRLNLYKAHSYLLVNIENVVSLERKYIIFVTGEKYGICEAYMYRLKRYINNFINS